MHVRVNVERLTKRLREFAACGADPAGGITRPFGSKADLEVREAFRREASAAGLEYRVDAAGNQWAVWAGQMAWARAIAVGSHLDTVPHGGAYDGAAGVLMSLEAVQSLKAAGYCNRHPLAVVAFTGEEPNPFGLSTLGSRLYTGRLDGPSLSGRTDPDGLSLQDALRRVGGDLFGCAALNPEELAAFIEPHVEQSGRLAAAGLPVGVVSRITGIYRDAFVLTGEQNHSGTTPLNDRRDALTAFGHAIVALDALLRKAWPEWMVGTIGHVRVYPNAINIVPSVVEFTVELRSTDAGQLQQCARRYRTWMREVMERQGIATSVENLLDQAPQPLSSTIQNVLREAGRARQLDPPVIPSWAGHDATHLARRVPTGMLFIRSLGGKSHCPDEESRLDDLALGTQILADALMTLDERLEEVTAHANTL